MNDDDIRIIRATLDRILASEGFRNSKKRRMVLSYIVEMTIAEKVDYLVLSALAHSLEMTEENLRTFVCALRKELYAYYGREGEEEQFEISIPPGHYIARFRRRRDGLLPAA